MTVMGVPQTNDDIGKPRPACFHCGEPVPEDLSLTVTINGQEQFMCCPGCQAVAQTIIACGLEKFYKIRNRLSLTPGETVPEQLRRLDIYDHELVKQQFVIQANDEHCETSLVMEGIVCPACLWLIETRVGALAGVVSISVNYETSRARLRWDDAVVRLSSILQEITRLGYSAFPSTGVQEHALLEQERKSQLQRLGLAGLLGMQVMMNSIALYTGDWSGADAALKNFLWWFNLVLTTPVVLFSAQPFYRGAWRDLKVLRAGMDVPVALGISIAYLGSVWATVTGAGDIYYDSVTMFVFLLLLGRYLEFMARRKARAQSDRINHALPAIATRLIKNDGRQREEIVPVAELKPGDLVLVRPGAAIPADGVVCMGASTVDEALLTGESMPIVKNHNAPLIAGSINIDSPLHMTITRVGADTVLAGIVNIIERARVEKPPYTLLANRCAFWFISAVLILAGAAAWYWWHVDRELWLPVTVAVLVATCPCALSLATPAAMTAASSTLLRLGMALANNKALEKLARATHIIFDKTGTLTQGQPVLDTIECLSTAGREECLTLMAALEKNSEHPVARAITTAAAGMAAATAIKNFPGRGIAGKVNGVEYFIGTEEFIQDQTGLDSVATLLPAPGADDRIQIFLADRKHWLCRCLLSDSLRPYAAELIRDLRQEGLHVTMLSGDHLGAVRGLAFRLGIDSYWAGQTPAAKLTRLAEIRKKNVAVAMVGDGINDAPVLAGADVSIAMGGGTDLARINADLIMLNDRLESLAKALRISRLTLAIIRQNIFWALAYNVLVLPAAALGLVAPWLAALGMSLSSLIVVGNASRIHRHA